MISQTKKEDIYIFNINIGGEDFGTEARIAASEFKNVQVFASDSYFSAFPGSIKDLTITSDTC